MGPAGTSSVGSGLRRRLQDALLSPAHSALSLPPPLRPVTVPPLLPSTPPLWPRPACPLLSPGLDEELPERSCILTHPAVSATPDTAWHQEGSHSVLDPESSFSSHLGKATRYGRFSSTPTLKPSNFPTDDILRVSRVAGLVQTVSLGFR